MHDASRVAEDSLAALVCQLAGYLRVNPLAGDTSEGVAQWWLGRSVVAVNLVEQALRWLESEGLVEAVEAADGRVHYRRARLDAAIDARFDQLIAGTYEPRRALT